MSWRSGRRRRQTPIGRAMIVVRDAVSRLTRVASTTHRSRNRTSTTQRPDFRRELEEPASEKDIGTTISTGHQDRRTSATTRAKAILGRVKPARHDQRTPRIFSTGPAC